MLYIFGGLPGTGKTELSRALAERKGAVFLRIDSKKRPGKLGVMWHVKQVVISGRSKARRRPIHCGYAFATKPCAGGVNWHVRHPLHSELRGPFVPWHRWTSKGSTSQHYQASSKPWPATITELPYFDAIRMTATLKGEITQTTRAKP